MEDRRPRNPNNSAPRNFSSILGVAVVEKETHMHADPLLQVAEAPTRGHRALYMLIVVKHNDMPWR